MEYRKVKNLTTSEQGSVFIAARQIYPDKTGLFPGDKSGEYITSEEIMETWDYQDSVVKGLDKQIAHANICPTKKDGTRDITPLVQWKENFKKRPDTAKTEKTFEIDLSKAVEGKYPDYTKCVTVQELSKTTQKVSNVQEDVSKDVQNKWIVKGKGYPTAQAAADATNNSLKNIQRWCKNGKNECSYRK